MATASIQSQTNSFCGNSLPHSHLDTRETHNFEEPYPQLHMEPAIEAPPLPRPSRYPMPQMDYAYAVADAPTTGYDKHLADERADAEEDSDD